MSLPKFADIISLSNTEIADFMGITLNNCQVKLHRVKEQVTKMIQKK